MKFRLFLSSINDKDHPTEMISRLLRVFPDGCRLPGIFSVHIDEDDPRAKEILLILNEYGLVPYTIGSVGIARNYQRQYLMSRYAVYDESDFETVELFIPIPLDPAALSWPSLSEPGIERRYIKKGVEILADSGAIFVSDKVRGLIESADLRGAVFRSLTLLKNVPRGQDAKTPRSWESVRGPWWWLTGGIVMPPLASRHPETRELHYRRSSLRRTPEFDVAKDEETPERVLVVSKRFYELCKKHGLKCGFKPIRVDED